LKPRFSVVIVTYRRPLELSLALESLEAQAGAPSHEVLIIDNDSQCSAKAVVNSFVVRHANWRYQASPRNNVSLARNLGAGLAQGEWLVFLDDDCVPLSGWLAEANRVIEDNPGPGLVLGGGYLGVVDPMAPVQILPKDKYLLEGNLFFPRRDYLSLAGMRTDLGPHSGRFGYHEGSELQMRHRQKFGADHRILLVPSLAVRHLEANRRGKSYLAVLAGFDGVRAFPQKSQSIFKLAYHLFKIPGPVIRLPLSWFETSRSSRKKRAEKEMYRLGEILGEIFTGLSALSRRFSHKLRRINNRRIGFRAADPEMRSYPQSRPLIAVPLPGPRGWMAGKVGTTELLALEFSERWVRPPWPKTASWRRAMRRLFVDSGVFPENKRQFEEFLKAYRQAIRKLDAVCVWQLDHFLRTYEELYLRDNCPHAERVSLNFLSTEILREIGNRRILVVSPFAKTMQRQASRLPEVHRRKPWATHLAGAADRCDFVCCPTFSFLQKSPFPNWSEGLEKLTEEVLGHDFEVALIGAGAWSLPLAAHLKQAGRVAIHMGGETQLLFGIKGQRWEAYGIYNEHWVRPSPEETPEGFLQKENGCYW